MERLVQPSGSAEDMPLDYINHIAERQLLRNASGLLLHPNGPDTLLRNDNAQILRFLNRPVGGAFADRHLLGQLPDRDLGTDL
ncbi:hypothetical protein D3C71_1954290 [compost metagenome]